MLRRVRDEVDRVRAAAVFGEGVVVEIQFTRFGIHHDIFEDRAEAFGGRENLGLGLGRAANHLGVTAALEIDDGGVRPAKLAVAEIGRAHGCTPVTNTHLVCRLLLVKKKTTYTMQYTTNKPNTHNC